MVFKIDKYTDKITSLLLEKNPQEALDNWITHSPASGKELSFVTYLPRKSTLRKFLANKHDFKYYIDDDEMNRFRDINTKRFEEKEQLTVDMGRINHFIERVRGQLDDDFTPEDKFKYVSKSKRNKTNINNKISNRILYLMLMSGRRINEFHNKIVGESKEEEESVEYTTSKKRVNRVETFKPLIDAKEWLDIYNTILPFIMNDSIETLTSRLNRFVKFIDPNFTLHSLRKVYAQLCADKNRKKTSKINKIKDCLNHDNVGSSVRYDVNQKNTKYCEKCDKSVLKRNFNRHLKTARHLN